MQDRLVNLYNVAGLNADDITNMAEIKAYEAGIHTVDALLNIGASGAYNFFLYPSKRAINEAFADISYTVAGKNVTITDYDINTIGGLVSSWFCLVSNVRLGSDGYSWSQWEDCHYNWLDVSRLELRWEMIESR